MLYIYTCTYICMLCIYIYIDMYNMYIYIYMCIYIFIHIIHVPLYPHDIPHVSCIPSSPFVHGFFARGPTSSPNAFIFEFGHVCDAQGP